jgi:hypothetical protein
MLPYSITNLHVGNLKLEQMYKLQMQSIQETMLHCQLKWAIYCLFYNNCQIINTLMPNEQKKKIIKYI